MTSLTPRRPRRTRPFRNVAQKVSASLGPICRPTISRLPSVFAATAIMAATETIRPRGPGHHAEAPAQGRLERDVAVPAHHGPDGVVVMQGIPDRPAITSTTHAQTRGDVRAAVARLGGRGRASGVCRRRGLRGTR